MGIPFPRAPAHVLYVYIYTSLLKGTDGVCCGSMVGGGFLNFSKIFREGFSFL